MSINPGVTVSLKILLASNDESVGPLFMKVLIRAEYEVTIVKSGVSAIAALLADEADYAMAILDSQVPPISGNRVVAVLREKGCRVPMMLASGSFIFDELPLGDPRIAFLTKPFKPEELLEAVRALLKKP